MGKKNTSTLTKTDHTTVWIFACEGKKIPEFSNLCGVLGVKFSLSHSARGVCQSGTLARHDALQLWGRGDRPLSFALSFASGKAVLCAPLLARKSAKLTCHASAVGGLRRWVLS